MKQVSIFPESIPEELRAGLDEIASREGFPVSPGDIRIVAQPGDRFEARREGRVLNVHYQKPVQFFRALSLLKDSGGREFAVCRQPLFQHNGAMLDCSRNAVLKPETLRLYHYRPDNFARGRGEGIQSIQELPGIPNGFGDAIRHSRFSQLCPNVLNLQIVPVAFLDKNSRIQHAPAPQPGQCVILPDEFGKLCLEFFCARFVPPAFPLDFFQL